MIVTRTRIVVNGFQEKRPAVLELFEEDLKHSDMLVVDDESLEIRFCIAFRMKGNYSFPDIFDILENEWKRMVAVYEITGGEKNPKKLFDIPFDAGLGKFENTGLLLDDFAHGRTNLSLEDIEEFIKL
jgi:hypothetical protein